MHLLPAGNNQQKHQLVPAARTEPHRVTVGTPLQPTPRDPRGPKWQLPPAQPAPCDKQGPHRHWLHPPPMSSPRGCRFSRPTTLTTPSSTRSGSSSTKQLLFSVCVHRRERSTHPGRARHPTTRPRTAAPRSRSSRRRSGACQRQYPWAMAPTACPPAWTIRPATIRTRHTSR